MSRNQSKSTLLTVEKKLGHRKNKTLSFLSSEVDKSLSDGLNCELLLKHCKSLTKLFYVLKKTDKFENYYFNYHFLWQLEGYDRAAQPPIVRPLLNIYHFWKLKVSIYLRFWDHSRTKLLKQGIWPFFLQPKVILLNENNTRQPHQLTRLLWKFQLNPSSYLW